VKTPNVFIVINFNVIVLLSLLNSNKVSFSLTIVIVDLKLKINRYGFSTAFTFKKKVPSSSAETFKKVFRFLEPTTIRLFFLFLRSIFFHWSTRLYPMGQSITAPDVGISYEAFLSHAVSMNIPTEYVDVTATFERYRDINSNLISADLVAELKLKTDVFLTHDWGIDELGRANHDRVGTINKELKSLGFVTWFDSEKMTG
jgi:hypothetical protein